MARKDSDSKTTGRRAVVLQSFSYTPDGKKTSLFITPASPPSLVEQVPADVMQQHVDTGFARWADDSAEA